MYPERQGWGAFGAYALGGDLPREAPLREIESRIRDLRAQKPQGADEEVARLEQSWRECATSVYADLDAWETVCLARHPYRPLVTDYISRIVSEFCELRGDRVFGDDPAIVTGFGRIGGHDVMLVGHNRGRDVAERVACRFGCARPEGYRKALSKMKLAAKFGVPIVTLLDTPGAYPGVESEQRGVARAIAENLWVMPRLGVPIVSLVIGEGGSGGALGLGVADELAMMEHSIFSVISPEGCAAILFKTSSRAREAAASLQLRSRDLLRLGLIDAVVEEPLGGAHREPRQAARSVEAYVAGALDRLKERSPEELRHSRYARWRRVGHAAERLASED